MVKNFQRYFRFYLASFLMGLLLVGIRWQSAPLGATVLAPAPSASGAPAAVAAHLGTAGTVALH